MEQYMEKEQVAAKASPETYRLKLPVCGVFCGAGEMGTRIPLSGKGLIRYQTQIQAFLQDMGGAVGGSSINNSKLLEGELPPEVREKIEWTDISVSPEGNTLYGWIVIQTKIRLSEREKQELSNFVERRFMEGWGERFSDSRLAVSGGSLCFWLKPPKQYLFTIQKKYKITQLSHPQYPWLHRIQALKTINEWVEAGELGGFVQSEQNLSQEGTCWIYDDAVCCGEAVVKQDAELHDGAVAAGFSIITGDACMYDRAWAKGNCWIQSGEVKDDAVAAGEAVIKKDGKGSPLIAGNSRVYGTVCGKYVIKDIIFPGETYQNPTEDILILENGKRSVLMQEQKFQPPKHVQKAEKTKDGMER
nr:hypothetical protein [uncultured Schaedlerella sp.]